LKPAEIERIYSKDLRGSDRWTWTTDPSIMKIIGDVIYRISYLAKVRGKGYRSQQAKDYGASRN